MRRLTPTEAERLQGYPDGWTEAGADGSPISDTKRYQMLGNSIAVLIGFPEVAAVNGGGLALHHSRAANQTGFQAILSLSPVLRILCRALQTPLIRRVKKEGKSYEPSKIIVSGTGNHPPLQFMLGVLSS